MSLVLGPNPGRVETYLFKKVKFNDDGILLISDELARFLRTPPL